MHLKNVSLLSTTVIVSVVITVLSLSIEVASKPSISEGWVEYHNRFGISDPQRRASQGCENSSREVRELCQRCAKVTKSKLAYPMCCEGRAEAREWCRELLMIG